jgi:type III secretion protein W
MPSGDMSDQLKQGLSSSEVQMKQILAAEELEFAQEETAMQVATERDMQNVFEDTANPLAASFKTSQKPKDDYKVLLKKAETDKIEKRIVPVKEADSWAENFSRQNPELKKQILLLLLDRIKDFQTKEQLLELLQQFYPDPTLADDVLNFLLKTTTGSLQKLVQEAKDDHQALFGREITAGQNIAEEVQRYAASGLGVPTKLRDMYRDITGNPREPVQLFVELSDKYAYKELRKVLAFLFHSLGTDLKSQGPSIPPGLLHRLLSEVRSLQAILGVYQFFRARMKLMEFLFKREGLEIPKSLNFELISKQFVNLLQERYPTGDKIMQTAGKLGIDKWILAKIIVFSQLRDAIREIALSQFYRNVQHRDELYNAIIEALEALEEELDELREQEEEEHEKRESGEEEKEEDSGKRKKK